MRKIFILLLFPFLGMAQLNKIDCIDLKEGVFKLESIDGSTHTIVRTKNKQSENVPKTRFISEMNIKWTSNCSYLLFNRKIIAGKNNLPDDLKIDTLYNEIVEINENKHKVISTMRGYDFKEESILIKIDTNSLYRNINEIEKFKKYNGDISGGALIGSSHSVAYNQNSLNENEYLLAFEEALSINYKSQYILLDNLIFQMKSDEKITTSNCRYEDKYDKEIIAIYKSKKSDKEAKIIKAWRLNVKTNKIEIVDCEKVKYKTADENLIFKD